ncbi:MAG: hypothetical protein WCZ19_05225, partial [Acholeplasma sp.]
RYRLGDRIRVKLIKVDSVDNNIDFTIDSKNQAQTHTKVNRSSRQKPSRNAQGSKQGNKPIHKKKRKHQSKKNITKK